ncbi:LysR family transcriptional regulator [Lacibacterium aquatile]|uniref:LysR family transcriptional regulator n=1 Tax=Lacibacterium aquatile TaxID=1168082 RepID=A0ABW5DTU2_9PROT
MIDFRNLETFFWVARLGSFRRTAEKLNTTQPAISARIAQLEANLNVQLIDREGRRAALTAKGVELLGYVEQLLALRDEMVLAVTDADSLKGTVRLGLSETIVHTWLPRLVKELYQRHPQITLEISVDVSVNLRDTLMEGQLDLAMLLGPISAPNVTNVPLCTYPIAWVASPDLVGGDEPLTLNALAQWPIITYSRASRPYHQLIELFKQNKVPGVRVFGNSSLSSIVRMTMDGIGISAIPPTVVQEELASGRLRLLPTQTALPDLVFTATYVNTPNNSLAILVANIAQQVAAAV